MIGINDVVMAFCKRLSQRCYAHKLHKRQGKGGRQKFAAKGTSFAVQGVVDSAWGGGGYCQPGGEMVHP